MSKAPKTVFRCASCGASASKWAGRCGSCGEWNTMAEEYDGPSGVTARALPPSEPALALTDIDPTDWAPRATGIAEFDRVLGGGLVPGSVTLVGGEPGIGKSTLVLQLLNAIAADGRTCLLVSGEESRQQIRLRAQRLGALSSRVFLAAETSLPDVLGHVEQVRPDVLVVDSIQTIADPALASAPGSVGQVRECANTLVRVAKSTDLTLLLIGHVTKEGALAGPRVLEHVVDTVLSFEGDRHHALRLLRAVKHRFGATGELGVFEMVEEGLVGVADPGRFFLNDRQVGAPGSVVASVLEGQRPLLVETQALVAKSNLAIPRRNAQGFDSGRLALLLAVLERRAKFAFGGADVFVSAVGGVRLTEPAGDLAVALAIASSAADKAIPGDVTAIGELGLAGEVRAVSHLSRRLAEAARLGFKTAVVPMSTPKADYGIALLRVATIVDAISEFDIRPTRILSTRSDSPPPSNDHGMVRRFGSSGTSESYRPEDDTNW